VLLERARPPVNLVSEVTIWQSCVGGGGGWGEGEHEREIKVEVVGVE
jgi:hypothetical protein